MSARSLNRLALCFLVLFLALVAGSIFPFQPLDAAWQNRICRTLLETATLPLLCLTVLQIGVLLDSSNRLLKERQRNYSRFAGAAALGFLLLIPLQISSSLHLQHSVSADQFRRLDAAERQLSALREAVKQATSSEDLSTRLQKLNGPRLTPADMALTTPLLKAEVNGTLDQAQIRIRRERSSLPSRNPMRLVPDLLRISVGYLGLAFGFAAFAYKPGSELSLLDQWESQPGRARKYRLPKQQNGNQISEAEYLRRLSGEDHSET